MSRFAFRRVLSALAIVCIGLTALSSPAIAVDEPPQQVEQQGHEPEEVTTGADTIIVKLDESQFDALVEGLVWVAAAAALAGGAALGATIGGAPWRY